MQAISDKTVLIEILTKVINKTNDHFDDIYLKEFVTDLKRENDFINNQITEKVSEIIEEETERVVELKTSELEDDIKDLEDYRDDLLDRLNDSEPIKEKLIIYAYKASIIFEKIVNKIESLSIDFDEFGLEPTTTTEKTGKQIKDDYITQLFKLTNSFKQLELPLNVNMYIIVNNLQNKIDNKNE